MAPDTMAAHRRTCYFTGRVQGVGFRYTVQNIALRHAVLGFVRNLNDGRVELVMEGPDSEMAGLLEDVQQKMAGYIRKIDTSISPATGEFAQFCVKH